MPPGEYDKRYRRRVCLWAPGPSSPGRSLHNSRWCARCSRRRRCNSHSRHPRRRPHLLPNRRHQLLRFRHHPSFPRDRQHRQRHRCCSKPNHSRCRDRGPGRRGAEGDGAASHRKRAILGPMWTPRRTRLSGRLPQKPDRWHGLPDLIAPALQVPAIAHRRDPSPETTGPGLRYPWHMRWWKLVVTPTLARISAGACATTSISGFYCVSPSPSPDRPRCELLIETPEGVWLG